MSMVYGDHRVKVFLIIYLLGKEVKWKVVPRNDDDIRALRESGKNFWENNIIPKVAPDPTGNKKETEQINEQQNLVDDEINLDNDLLEQYQECSDKVKELEKEKRESNKNFSYKWEMQKKLQMVI